MRRKFFRKNRKFIVWSIVAFVLLLAINAALIFLAFSTWSGKFTGEGINKYNRDVEYNRVASQLDKQKSLNWTWSLNYPRGTIVEFALKDAHALLVQGKQVTLKARHSSDPTMDREMRMQQNDKGVYSADLGTKGFWYLDVEVMEDGELIFLASDKVVLEDES